MNKSSWTRRDIVRLSLALGLQPAISMAADESMITRAIPSSGEALPVIGLGTYNVFDVASTADNIESRAAIVDLLTGRGASVLDSSPMYNRSEGVIGDIISARKNREQLFLATKVWTEGKAAGEQQMARSAELMQTDVIDLMQVHNLLDVDAHLRTIKEWQADKRIRYNGVTHYRAGAHDDIEKIMRTYRPEFIQINYSLGERAADERVLPAAQELGIAVLANRPFVAGQLFRAVGDRPLPDWSAVFADSWGQFFLKYIISHPAITCVIPATSKPHHMTDNLSAGFGELPDVATRRRMVSFIESL